MLPTVNTPLISLCNLFPGGRVHAKCEFLAPSGSFKIHGATHLLEHLIHQGKTRRLVVPSMGNTALGAAVAAKEFGFTMTGVVPQAISRAKDQKLQELGVELVKIAGGGTDLLNRATHLAAETGGYFVHPHLDSFWTDGYQVIARQIWERLPDCRTLVFPVGGGGLLMGLTEFCQRQSLSVRLIGCEAYNYPTYAAFDHERSRTIADGLVLEVPHERVKERIKAAGVALQLVREPEIQAAMADLYTQHGLVVEPSSAVTIAWIKAHREELEEPVCAILTGSNIGREDFMQLVG
jgi:threonine dehydratase